MFLNWWFLLAPLLGILAADLMSPDSDTLLIFSILKWLSIPLWGPIVLIFWYVDRTHKAKRRNADIRVWLKAELTHNAEIQHLAYQQGLIENDWRLVRAGTYGEYDPVLEEVA